jgi:hypothetical protein
MPLPALTKRLVKGSPLTATEGDNNLTTIQQGVDTLETRINISLNADGTLKLPTVLYGTSANGTAAYTTTLNATVAALSDLTGKLILMKADVANNTTATTLAVNGLAAKVIKKHKDQLLLNGDIKPGMICQLVYDVTNDWYVLQNPAVRIPWVYATDSGGANAYVVNITYGSMGINEPTTYTTGQLVYMKAANKNTTAAATLKITFTGDVYNKDMGVQTIKKYVNQALVALDVGDIQAGEIYALMFDGTYWQLLNPSQHAGLAKAWVSFALDGGTIGESFNVSGVVKNSTGDYTVSFTTPFAAATYLVATGMQLAAFSNAKEFRVKTGGRAVGSCRFECGDGVTVQDVTSGVGFAVFYGAQ